MDDSGEPRIPQRHVAELSAFFTAHDRWLFGHACVRTRGDRELAADLVQDTFEAAARAWATVRGAGAVLSVRPGRREGSGVMTAGSEAPRDGADLFVADFYPKLGEYLAGQHAAGYDAGSGRARFEAWLGEHAEGTGDPDQVR